MKNSLGMTAGEVLDSWFAGGANDEDVIALFLPTKDLPPLERVRKIAQAMNLAQQMMELTRLSLLQEGERTAEALEIASSTSGGSENSLQLATNYALEKNFDALQILAQGFEEINATKVLRALELAEQAEAALRKTSQAVRVVQEHLTP